MELAHYGKKGDLVNVRAFLERQGTTDPKKWDVQPLDPETGEVVQPYNKKGALVFLDAAANEVSTRRFPGFRRYHHAGAAHLPSTRHKKRKAQALSAHRRYKVRDGIKKVLRSPEIKSLNKKVLWALAARVMDGKNFSRKAYDKIAKLNKVYDIEALATYPWLLPYILAVLNGHSKRTVELNRQSTMCYRALGTQDLHYIDRHGKQRRIIAPAELQPCFVNRVGRQVEFTPLKNPTTDKLITFPVSLEAAQLMQPARDIEKATVREEKPAQTRLDF
jgi:hypothetical protein